MQELRPLVDQEGKRPWHKHFHRRALPNSKHLAIWIGKYIDKYDIWLRYSDSGIPGTDYPHGDLWLLEKRYGGMKLLGEPLDHPGQCSVLGWIGIGILPPDWARPNHAWIGWQHPVHATESWEELLPQYNELILKPTAELLERFFAKESGQ